MRPSLVRGERKQGRASASFTRQPRRLCSGRENPDNTFDGRRKCEELFHGRCNGEEVIERFGWVKRLVIARCMDTKFRRETVREGFEPSVAFWTTAL